MTTPSEQRNSTPTTSGSVTGSTQRRPTMTEDDKIKVNKPDVYHGDRNGLEDWLLQLEMYFTFVHVPSEKKTLFATTYLRGRAEQWIKPAMKSFLDDGEDEGRLFENFTNFKARIRKIFGVSNEEQTAERVIQHLRQKNSAADFAARFQQYSQLTKWDDAALMVMFRRELKDNVKDELMRYGEVNSLDSLIKAAIELDDRLYERAMEKRHDDPRGRAGTYTGDNRRDQGAIPTFRNQGKPNNYYGPMPMELGTTLRQQKPKGRKGFKKSKNEKKCYACGKPGHFARDCRQKSVMPQRQINATLRKVPETDDDWEQAVSDTDTLEISSDDEEYLHVNSREEFQEILRRQEPRATASTTRPPTLYPTPEKDNWEQDFQGTILEAMNELDSRPRQVTTTSEEITDQLEQVLGSNATIENDIPKEHRSSVNRDQSEEHGLLSWTVCYDDSCMIHYSEKEGSGWFPRKSSQRRNQLDVCPHDDWRMCQDYNCAEHIEEAVTSWKKNYSHEALDWPMCEDRE